MSNGFFKVLLRFSCIIQDTRGKAWEQAYEEDAFDETSDCDTIGCDAVLYSGSFLCGGIGAAAPDERGIHGHPAGETGRRQGNAP